ncbi:MAG: hypothetical protein CM15mP93_17020 [Thiotrichaceae bacterium]|jgi:Rps23 Pro-64 3,4-dihydroxylase Tpa1-like proline 4-hydroxylase|nr:hypothetical protein [Candidatus Neomarinimicrobiota bacterium]GIR93515.1 MAG: hypothetical protein CM15mP93_17020 [Thiotrichaceae bacterium]|tara:strand:+ start:25 stop:675 length:651 start_codon:yes stop_codon:yes gene_type:complete
MEGNNLDNLENFNSRGFCIIDNFLNDKTSKELLSTFKDINKWDRVDQVRSHYEKGGPFEMNSIYFPNHDEEYYLQGWRAKNFEESKSWVNYFNQYFLTTISELFQKKIQRDTTYILKYSKNDFSRIHVDDLRGDVDRVDISILYYLCDNWIWDWGGILMLAESTESEDMISIMPKNNRLILLNNQMKLPHCVTPVANYAKNDRYTVASFIGCESPF